MADPKRGSSYAALGTKPGWRIFGVTCQMVELLGDDWGLIPGGWRLASFPMPCHDENNEVQW